MSKSPQKGKSRATDAKFKYVEMISDAICKLGERKGSSREAIWKFLMTRYQASIRDKKIFLVQLKRIADNGKFVKKSDNNQMRYKLTPGFRERYLR